MPRLARRKSKTEIYHVMLRGNERKQIFLDEEDRIRFIDTIRIKGTENNHIIYGYCLMDNHVHLLISAGEEGIAKAMKRINVSYAYYFNKKYKRCGHLFQDRFKSEEVEDERYLLEVIRYIHNNPVKAGMVENCMEYKWSSYLNYMKRVPGGFVEVSTILGIFSNKRKRARELFNEYSKRLNDDVFLDVCEKNEEEKKEEVKMEAEKIILNYLKRKKIDSDALKEKENKDMRNELIMIMKNEGSFSIREIARFLDLNRGVVQKVIGKR